MYTPEQQAIRAFLSKPAPFSSACGCMGPQDNEPVCPCAMAWVSKIDDVFYQITEHPSPDGITHTAEAMEVPTHYHDTVDLFLMSKPSDAHAIVTLKNILGLPLQDTLRLVNSAPCALRVEIFRGDAQHMQYLIMSQCRNVELKIV